MVRVKCTVSLSCVIFAVFVLQQFVDLSAFYLTGSEVLNQPWTIITHIFLHGSLLHVGSNLFALLLFGSILENITGGKRLLLVFFVSGVASAAGDILFYPVALGASGAIFGVMGCLAMIRPRLAVWVLSVPMPMIAAVVVWFLLDFAGIFAPDNIAHAAHIFGLGFGVIYGLWNRKGFAEPPQEKKTDILTEEEMTEWEETYMH